MGGRCWVLAWTLIASGCGNNSSNNNNNTEDDLSMPSTADLAGVDLTGATTPDLTVPPGADLATLPDLALPLNIPDGMVHIAGSAAKGPFISGVNVDVQGLNPSTLNPIPGTSVSGQTLDNAGEFAMDVFPGLTQIHVNGQFYQEISGTVSTGAQDLFAIVNLVASGSATVNLVTHLTSQRIKNLMLGGSAYDAAVTQAESELELGLAIGGVTPGVPGAQMSFLAGDTLPSAYLFAMSATFDREAKIAGNTTSLQEQINTVESDLASNGVVDANTLALMRRAQVCVRPSDVMQKLQARFNTIGSSATVPNINRALDSDLDGTPNLSDTCLRWSNPSPTPSPANVVCDSSIDNAQPTSTQLQSVDVVRSADLNGDGAADLVVLGRKPQSIGSILGIEYVVVWLGSGDRTLQTPTAPIDLTAALNATNGLVLVQARLGDVDGDSKVDLVVSYGLAGSGGSQPGYPKLAYLPGDGAGGFGTPVAIEPTGDPYQCGTGFGNMYCNSGQVCSGTPPSGTCNSDCRITGTCNGSGTCDSGTGACTCGAGPACSGGTPYCVNNACSASPPCTQSGCMNGNICNTTTGLCQCNGGTACTNTTQCVNNSACISDCTQLGQTCPIGYTCDSAGSHQCRQICAGAPGGFCNSGQVCSGGTTCVNDCRTSFSGCMGAGTCGTSTGLCTCGGGGACGGGTPYCVNGTCGSTQPCSSKGGPGTTTCSNSMSCNDATGQCYCGTPGTTCTGGDQCTNGSCAVACGAGPGAHCNPGETCVSSMCKCGSGAGCQFGQICDTGVNGGTCFASCGNVHCAPGQVCINDACVTQPYAGVLDFELADFDGDNKLDIAGAEFGGVLSSNGFGFNYSASRLARIVFLKGDGSGGFAAPVVSTASATASMDVVQIALGDIDGANHADLALSLRKYENFVNPNTETWSATVLLNDGSGHFAQPGSPSNLSGPFTGRVVPKLGDADANAVNDLYLLEGAATSFGSNGNQIVHILMGDHAGHFAGGGTLNVTAGGGGIGGGSYPFPAGNPYSYADCSDARPLALSFASSQGELGVGDLDGDGKADVMAQDGVFLSTGAATFGSPGRLEGLGSSAPGGANSMAPYYQGVPDISGPALIDLDGDGKAEVVFVSATTSTPGTSIASPWVGRVNPPNVHTW